MSRSFAPIRSVDDTDLIIELGGGKRVDIVYTAQILIFV